MHAVREYSTTAAGRPLRLRALRLGADWCLLLTGGDAEHLGASALAAPRPSLADPGKISATASVLALPGHKEDLPARELSLKAAAALDAAVCVCCGIHLDKAGPEEIEAVLVAARGLVEEFLRESNTSTL